MRILGIDPGLQVTGFGVIDVNAGKTTHVASGCIRTAKSSLPDRLREIFEGVRELAIEHRPDCMVVEQVFMNRNADSALKLGQARGAAICAGVTRSIPVHEYTPRQIKQSIVGTGAADKQQVQHMVRVLAGVAKPLAMDASDALAVALCHSHTNQTLSKLGEARHFRRGRLQ